MLKDVAGQLKTNGVNIQEAKYIVADELYKHLSVLNEGRKSRGDVTTPEVDAKEAGELLQVTDSILDALASVEEVQKFAAAVGEGKHPDGKTQMNKGGSRKLQTYYTKGDGKKKIEDKIKSFEKKPEQAKGKLRFDAVPDMFKKLWDRVTGPDNKKAGGLSAEDAWKKMPSGKSSRKVQTIREAEGTASGIGSSAERSTEKFGQQTKRSAFGAGTEDVELTKVAWFKVQQDAPRMTSDKDLMTRNFDPRGSSDKEVVSGMKAFVGALMNKMKQYATGGSGETSRRQGKAGVVNTKNVVGTRLKQGGIDIKSPEGRKLQNRIQKVIRRFLRKNLQRIGKDVNLIAEQKVEDRLVEYVTNYIIENNLYNKGET